MSIATKPSSNRSISRNTGCETVDARNDEAFAGQPVDRLLELGLNKYQLRLNSHLLTKVRTEFKRWVADQGDEVRNQLNSVPTHARERRMGNRASLDDRRGPQNQSLRVLADFLIQFSQVKLKELATLKEGNAKFRLSFNRVTGEKERQKVILNYAAELGASKKQLAGDARAFARWFDEEAVTDRFAKRVGESELMLVFLLDRLAEVFVRIFQVAKSLHRKSLTGRKQVDYESLHKRLKGIWRRLKIERRTNDALMYDGDVRVQAAVLDFLARVTAAIPGDIALDLFDDRLRFSILRIAMQSSSDVWVQCNAISVLCSLSFHDALPSLKRRLVEPATGDDIFVRRHALKMMEMELVRRVETGADRSLQLPAHKNESSEFVRQKFAKVAFLSTDLPARQQWRDLVLHDDVDAVQAAALLAGIEVRVDLATTMDYLAVVEQCLKSKASTYVLRVAFHCIIELLKQVEHLPTQDKYRQSIHTFCAELIQPQIAKLQSTSQDTFLRRCASQSRQIIWAALDVEASALISKLRPQLLKTPPGRSCRLPRNVFAGIGEEKLGRIFAVLSTDDFGYDVHKTWRGYRVFRGPTFGFRLWRAIFEFRNTATDKRQAICHTVGRINNGTFRSHSQILGELSETKVPGEPLTIGEDGTWRPFIPLLDDFVSVLNLSWFRPKEVKFYTSQGLTKVTGPRGIFARIKASWKLNFGFAQIATKRNWDQDSYAPDEFVNEMRQLGFEVNFTEYQPESGSETAVEPDESVTRFFGAAATMMPLPLIFSQSSILSQSEFWSVIEKYSEYFGSAFENSLEELVVFGGLLMLFVFGKHFYSNYKFRKARQKIPLSLGGWGTRGKSGTERLKAALIGVMGYGLVSKTTGCEAMFIHGDAHGDPLEIPLFRPYDKATIWEQLNLIRLASKMNPAVFLWECMALTPAFVDVLQRQWMRDDISTITNTYPDHEDVQGPAGYNVAQTISGFVPLNSHLISTEEVMRPYVTESCRLANTSFRGVGWLESGLVTDDVQARFPYQEHPDNIALVAALGAELGCDYEYSLKGMSDLLVPDLGVLKTHHPSRIRTRTIEFTNGCSANERFGCMGNVRRLGYDTQDPWEEPTTWVCGVVNNRADRIPRSKVFAKIIVEDINADRFFLIGSNLKGLRGFIEEAWDEKAKTISLRNSDKLWAIDFALAALKKAAWDMRQPIDGETIASKLKCMIAAISTGKLVDADKVADAWDSPDSVQLLLESANVEPKMVESVFYHHSQWFDAMNSYRELESLIKSSSADQADALEQQYKELLKAWYDRKIVVIENFDATGEEVLASIVEETPPGFLNRAMGLQNIKGTGLDFVYRFQAWDTCFDACKAAMGSKLTTVEKGLQVLVSLPEIGQLCQAMISEVIDHGRESKLYERPELQMLLDQLESKLNAVKDSSDVNQAENQENAKEKKNSQSRLRAELNAWMLDATEQFLDVHDSIHRRDKADLIYKDLAAGRISRLRAVVELRKINKRQKGGWYVGKKMAKQQSATG